MSSLFAASVISRKKVHQILSATLSVKVSHVFIERFRDVEDTSLNRLKILILYLGSNVAVTE
jgi:hypothetical protein